MADIRNDQYLHRPGAGRGAITSADPFEVLLYDGAGNPLLVKTPTGETRQALGVAGYGHDGTSWRPVKVNASGQAEVQLTGSYVAAGTDGADVIRIKQQELAYRSLDFNNSETITVTAGSTLLETTVHPVNGFGKVGILIREVNGVAHQFWFRIQWSSVPTAPTNRQFHSEPVPQTTASGATTISETYSQYMRGELQNMDTNDHTYHVHYLLRAS